ncbi:12121_t:CDS:2, partial [Entrophospora sp. SA101]
QSEYGKKSSDYKNSYMDFKVAKLMKKEEIRQLASAFGHNLSEQQINLMMTSMERAMEQAKAKSKKSK